jgi:hypothetical protein
MKLIYYMFVIFLIIGNPIFATEKSSCELKLQSPEMETLNWTKLYSIARCYASMGDKIHSNKFLVDAIENGFTDIEKIQNIADFEILKNTPEWEDYFVITSELDKDFLSNINLELYQMYKRDQAVRTQRENGWDWDLHPYEFDKERLKRTIELHVLGKIISAEDNFHAALIMQHGQKSEDYKLAHQFALKVVELKSNYQHAKWLTCATEDRYLRSLGKPQVWGTQRKIGDNGWTLEPFDRNVKSDKQRTEHGVPVLANLKKRIDWLNSQ